MPNTRQIANTVLLGLTILALLSSFALYLSTPFVEWSWATNTCVKVDPATAGTCVALPDRYELVWVQ